MSAEHRCKSLQTSANNSVAHQDDCHHKLGFIPGMQGWLNLCKSISGIYHKMKDFKKSFNKMQHTFVLRP